MRILIVTEQFAGNGHRKAAESIARAINNLEPLHEITVINLLSIINKSLEHGLKWSYMTLIMKYPRLWGWVHKRESYFSYFFKDFIANVILLKLKKYIESKKPDLIIATHASGLGALAKLKGKYKFTLAVAFTDYHVNSFWVNNAIDYYFVAHQDLKISLINKYKVEADKIYVTGIPIDPVFASVNKQDPAINKEIFRVLIMGGGLGLGGIKDIINALNELDGLPIEVTVVTGTNQTLFAELNYLKETLSFPMEVHKYLENIYTLMANSDLLITKSGGLTISEAMTIPIPLLIYKPIPGQEELNAKFLIDHKAAILINNANLIPYWIDYFYKHPKLYIKLKEKAERIAKADSSIQIGQILLNKKSHI